MNSRWLLVGRLSPLSLAEGRVAAGEWWLSWEQDTAVLRGGTGRDNPLRLITWWIARANFYRKRPI